MDTHLNMCTSAGIDAEKLILQKLCDCDGNREEAGEEKRNGSTRIFGTTFTVHTYMCSWDAHGTRMAAVMSRVRACVRGKNKFYIVKRVSLSTAAGVPSFSRL